MYVDSVMLLSFAVDWLLLMGTNKLCNYPPDWKNTLPAAAFGGVYAGACLLSRYSFFGNGISRILSLLIMAWISYGISFEAVRRTVVFIVLNMALGGIALGFGNHGWLSVATAGVSLFGVCLLGVRSGVGTSTYVPVELRHGKAHLYLTALRDTGNTLHDPVTGRAVLVVDADTAQRLTGLTQQQLRSPVEAIAQGAVPGLRLIPYHTVGQSAGLLLAIYIKEVRIGQWRGSSLVALAPNGLSKEGTYQALTGGTV